MKVSRALLGLVVFATAALIYWISAPGFQPNHALQPVPAHPPTPPAAVRTQEAPHTGFDRRPVSVGHQEKARQEARERQKEAAARLQSMVPGTRVDFDPQLGTPHFVASTQRFLTGANGVGGGVSAEQAQAFPETDAHRAVKAFLAEHVNLFGHGPEILRDATMARDYVTEHNGLRTSAWQQSLEGVRVFEATLQAHVTRNGALVNIASRLIPDPRAAAANGAPNFAQTLSKPPVNPRQAISEAATTIGETVAPARIVASDEPDGASRRQRFRSAALLDVVAEYIWLPLDADSLRLCWDITFMSKKRGEMFRTLVDAETGTALVQHRLTEYISPASYRVFTSDSPTPMSPGHATPLTTQPATVSRQLVTLDALNTTASPNGWIDDGMMETRGNNVDAHLDINADNVADTPRPQASGVGRVFDPAMDLTQAPSTYGSAAVVNLFYWNNLIHDRYYALGFTEAAGNFQLNNFGRGGSGNDAVQADAQDGSGTNNANFSTPPDGSPGRMQMYTFTGPTPDRDGDFDQEIIIHEYTHGLSNRLVGGGVGLSALQSRGMGEGWSDFYGLCLLSEPGDNPNGTYAAGAYASHQLSGLAQSYYFGIRRYPYCTDLTKNPLTFKDIDPGQASAHAGVPKSPLGGGSADQVHNQGEVWCVTLWDARANLIAKHGATAGNDLILKLVTDGMKLAPANPNFLQARDGILQAELVYTGGANRGELWTAFAKRGMGATATSPASSTTAGLVATHDIPDNLAVSPMFTVTPAGTIGGPFTPDNTSYTLTNSGSASFTWTASDNQPWLSLSATAGTLDPGNNTTVVASLNSASTSLAPGTYLATLTFQNTTSGISQQRSIALTVEAFLETVFFENFEAATLAPHWTITGTGSHRTVLTTANGPRGGAQHLTMDSNTDNSYARNEATLTLNLAGRQNLTLRFWAKMFNDEPEGPPSSPIPSTGADFDGVAISADGGVQWHEIQGLRSLSAEWQQISVDLDAAVAALGLSYTSAFKIRFNHYDNYTIPTDGFAFDDIQVARFYTQSLVVSVPAALNEISLPATGTISVNPTPSTDLTLSLASSLPSSLQVPSSVTILAGQSSAPFSILPTDDALLNGTRAVTISASAAGYVAASGIAQFHDNETATISFTLPASASEGTSDLSGTVTLSAPADADVKIALSSDDAQEITPPQFVTIAAGQNSATFHLDVVDDDRIDGPRTTTVTASVMNWTAGSATITILDNETSDLTVSLPPAAREGDLALTGTIRISGSLTTPLVVGLTSSDLTEITVPASVTIAAGQKSVTFPITIVDDVNSDGAQAVTISASAESFNSGSATISVADNDAHHFTISPIPETVLRNAAVPVTITARDLNDAIIPNYNQVIQLSAADSAGTGVPVSPANASNFVSGVASASLAFGAYGSGVVLTATDAGDRVGASNSFDVSFGPVARFAWDSLAPIQNVDAPFPVRIRAVDSAGNTVPTFNGTASLNVPVNSQVQVLSWTAYADTSVGGEYANTKAAIASTFGNFTESSTTTTSAATLSSLLVGKNVFLIIEQELSSPSTLATQGTAWASVLSNFANSGGTVIACSNTTSEHLLLTNSGLLNATGLASPDSASITKTADTPLNAGVATPFTGDWLHTYASTDAITSLHLTTGEAIVLSRDFGTGRAILIGTDYHTLGTGMDRIIANAVALAAPPSLTTLPVTPGLAAPFAAGEWTGNVSLPFTGNNVVLRASSASLSGDSNAIAVIAPTLPTSSETVLTETFENGTLSPAIWKVTGTGGFHTVASNQNGPHAGTWHMTMDEATGSATFARNEATLAVNLAGRSGARLTFWAKMFGDDPHGPPVAPFIGGADFDGVAISADGTTWWEVQSLRSPTVNASWAQFTVDLDAAIASRGLAYNSAFRIRFNQYDDYAIPTDGIAIDDIAITATALPVGITLTAPAQATEGAGSLSGTVAVLTPAGSDTIVTLASLAAAKVTIPASITIPAGQITANFPITVLDDPHVDGPKAVILSAALPNGEVAYASIQVRDNDAGSLAISAPSSVAESAAGLNATLTLSTPSLALTTISLTSSLPARLQVPATITIPRGHSSVQVPLTVPENSFIEGSQTAVIAAAATDWAGAATNVQVLDNESLALALAIPSTFREGDASKTGTVSTSGILTSDLVVTLVSSDPTAVTAPATVTIPAGQSSAAFAIAVVDDQVADGHQPFSITAGAAGFTGTSVNGVARDNEAHHFTFAPIASPQVANGPVPVAVTARDSSGAIIADFKSAFLLSATSNAGVRVVSPGIGGTFFNGVWNGSVQIDGPATNVVITATAVAGQSGSSNAFDLEAGNLNRFVWDPIPGAQVMDTPFNASIRAVDPAGATVTAYNGSAKLHVIAPLQGAQIGTAAGTAFSTLSVSSHDSRSISHYQAFELGGAGPITAISINPKSLSGAETLTNLTIRLKHTSLPNLSGITAWDNAGWTQVYRASPTISATGWVTFTFVTPFEYNGTSNLLVDLSFDRTTTNTGHLYLQGTSTAAVSMLYGSSNSAAGDPLTWSNSTPYIYSTYQRADLRLTTLKPIPIRPASTPAFAAGVWTGQVSVPISGAGLSLQAEAGAVTGLSNPINVTTLPPIATGPDIVYSETFESGTLNPNFWKVTGTNGYHTIASNLNVPHGGAWHMTMDEATNSGTYARNEATLTVNLAGRSGVTLTFWAKMFSEEADGPPTAPFTGGADFDGVAMSADGITWWEIQSLRSPAISSNWTQFTIDLDAAIAARGISYNGTFKVRFNQYDDFAISMDGIAVDDIAITASNISGFAFSGPNQATEGSGNLSLIATLETAAVTSTTIPLTSSAPAKISVPASVTIEAGQTTATFDCVVLDDTITDGDRLVAISGTLGGQARAVLITVTDNDWLPVGLVVPATMTENATNQIGWVTLGAAASIPLTVTLQSSDSTAATVPASVLLLSGQTSIPFAIAPVDDSKIDGTQTTTITAKVAEWTAVTSEVQVTDNETRGLALSVPNSITEGTTGTCTVSISGTLPAPLVVSLASSIPSQMTVPASVTIPAGQTSVTFLASVVDDSAKDGVQIVAITATASTFLTGSASLNASDNDVHHFRFSTISNQVKGRPFSVSMSARDVNGAPIATHNGTADLQAIAGGSPISVTPSMVAFSSGSSVVPVTINAFATSVTLELSTFSVHQSASNAFNVTAGALDRLVWGTIPATVAPNDPIAASLAAQDAYGNLITTFNGDAMVTAGPPQRVVGTGTIVNTQPLYTSAHESRMQCLYLASELGSAGSITGLSLDVAFLPSLPMTRFTVRVKPTALATTTAWESTGWTTVFQSTLTVTNTGWQFLPFSTPVAHDGTSNLLVDFSFDNATSGPSGTVRSTSTASTRAIYYYATKFSGDPLTWSGSTPGIFTSTSLPNARFRFAPAIGVNPSTVTLTAGTWNGALSVTDKGTGITLRADSAAGLSGESNPFTATSPASLGVTSVVALTTSGPRAKAFTPLTHTFTLHNAGTGTMEWQASSVAPWLALSATSGSIPAGAISTITAALDPAMLAALPSGTTSGTISIANLSNGIGNTTRAVEVTVIPHGDLTVTGSDGNYTVGNSGDAELTWAIGNVPLWLQASTSGGVLAPGASVPLNIVVNGFDPSLPPGRYVTTITLTNTSTGFGNTSVVFAHEIKPTVGMIPEPLVTGGDLNLIEWNGLSNADAYELAWGQDALFVAAQTTEWLPNPAHNLVGLSDGQTYHYRARPRITGQVMNVWAQSSTAEFLTGTATNVESGATGIVLKKFPGTAMAGRILNPSFELDAVDSSTITSWTQTLSGGTRTSISSSSESAPLPTQGTRYAQLWTDLDMHNPGEWIRQSQNIEFTGAQSLVFDACLTKTAGYNWASAIQAAVYIDGVIVWSRAAEGAATNQSVDVSHLTGIHTVSLGSNVIAAGNYAPQWACFDNLRLIGIPTNYMVSGTLVSRAIVLNPERWGQLVFKVETPAGTAVNVDVLDLSNAVLASDVPLGADLGSIPSVAGKAAIRLRARLSTSNPAATPRLLGWAVTGSTPAMATVVGNWSAGVMSTQDATAPTLTRSLTASSANPIVTPAGGAFDATAGVASVLVNGRAVASTDGFATWTAAPFLLGPGQNTITVVATDHAVPPNSRSESWEVTYTGPATTDADNDGLPDAWEMAHDLNPADPAAAQGAQGDIDLDGISNFLEYAFDSNPRHSSRDALPAAETRINPADGKPYLEFTYRRRLGSAGLTWAVETSPDCKSWTSNASAYEAVGVAAISGNSNVESVTVRILPSIGTSGVHARFVRLQVAAP